MKSFLIAAIAVLLSLLVATAHAESVPSESADDTSATDEVPARVQSPAELAAQEAEEDKAYWSKKLPMHPKVVHFPMALCILMPIVIIAAWVGRRRGWINANAWLLVLLLQGACFASSIAALRTGEEEGEACSGCVSDKRLAAHHDAAEMFVIVAGVNLGLVLLLLAMRNKERAEKWLPALVLAGAIGGAVAGVNVGDAGGRIVYVGAGADIHK